MKLKSLFVVFGIILSCNKVQFPDRYIYKLHVVYKDGKRQNTFVEFAKESDGNLILEQDCIKYGDKKNTLFCNVRKFSSKRLE